MKNSKRKILAKPALREQKSPVKPNPDPPDKVVVARASFVRHSPRKLRLVAQVVRGADPNKAIGYLKLLPHRAAGSLIKVYQQALANAKNAGLSPADLTVKSLQIEEGPKGAKKADVHAHGARYDRGIRRKRMAHIRLELITKTRYGAKN
ncbi:MAG: 50S ribosomal protein L22 [Candidatus Amesbacteria bacterium GW2011_GWA2_47_11]|uniref:50S ribosomal protein L22 n=4 Tax=Microgenomates group TaxID=1794810 RepID=A0A0H4TM54_9BACT|nr:putative 50S ribosomal protein L22 RPLV, large subunit ribosomal protein L22 [uncultured Microgenomates bacterium Rifle_16ft_4_minimus_21028]KKU56909.1 MAG: 50S ribosomal protein L22 [Candidatus Amesbacteria bacterium GW2011_GWA2_47_11]KKU94858.1 MAG: 50S ribosomal protein L22 [Candidatus Amesbacteria bacterium GW2011_GWC1_48_10]KKW01046.1 MAG: 50S ribosomal protein L22 [Candidatus Amesbacteria bacterium GW2011_GWA1_48_9]